MPKASDINEMFGTIAPSYDRANHWLSFGVDYYWRYRLVQKVKALNPCSVVDLATGSGDVAFALKKALGENVSVKGLDFCEPMLELARKKDTTNSLSFEYGDCLDLPLEDSSVDVLTIAFGFRNFEDRHRGLQKMHRVLKPSSGRLFILEFTQPYPWFRPIYYFYLKSILPVIAFVTTCNKIGYKYLIDSIEAFPTANAIEKEILAAGFSKVHCTKLTQGIVAIHEASI